jgi:hypothetical protein
MKKPVNPTENAEVTGVSVQGKGRQVVKTPVEPSTEAPIAGLDALLNAQQAQAERQEVPQEGARKRRAARGRRKSGDEAEAVVQQDGAPEREASVDLAAAAEVVGVPLTSLEGEGAGEQAAGADRVRLAQATGADGKTASDVGGGLGLESAWAPLPFGGMVPLLIGGGAVVAAGSGGGGGGAAAPAPDTTRPTARIELDDSVLTVAQTTTVRVTFSEPVSGFTLEDLVVAGGAMCSLAGK